MLSLFALASRYLTIQLRLLKALVRIYSSAEEAIDKDESSILYSIFSTTDNLSYILPTYILFTYTLSIYILSIYTLSIYTLSIYALFIYTLYDRYNSLSISLSNILSYYLELEFI